MQNKANEERLILCDEIKTLRENINSTMALGIQVSNMDGQLNSFIWNFQGMIQGAEQTLSTINNINSSVNNALSQMYCIQPMQSSFEMVLKDLQNDSNNIRVTLAENITRLNEQIKKLDNTVKDINSITNNATIKNILEEMAEDNARIESICGGEDNAL